MMIGIKLIEHVVTGKTRLKLVGFEDLYKRNWISAEEMRLYLTYNNNCVRVNGLDFSIC